MKPMSEDSHCSAKPVRYVLEMNQGWFAKRASRPAPSWAARPSIAKRRQNQHPSCSTGRGFRKR
jgi:hypothetical protein